MGHGDYVSAIKYAYTYFQGYKKKEFRILAIMELRVQEGLTWSINMKQ